MKKAPSFINLTVAILYLYWAHKQLRRIVKGHQRNSHIFQLWYIEQDKPQTQSDACTICTRAYPFRGTSLAEWFRRLVLKLLAPLRCYSGSNPMRGSCQLLTEDCWFTHRNRLFLQLWKLTAIYNQINTNSINSNLNIPLTTQIN